MTPTLMDRFVVRHYCAEDRPTIKGNGFDGLEIGEDRKEAKEFIQFVNILIERIQDVWQSIGTAPKDGTEVILFCPNIKYPLTHPWGYEIEIGSWRVDDGCSGDKEPLWLDNSYNDFSTGYASNPLEPTHWMPLPAPPNEKAKPKSGIGSKFDDFLKEEGIYDSVLKALMAIVPDEDGDGWWCPECRAHISCVTNDESCTMCGTYLADVQPSEKWLKDARYAIAAAQECKKRRHERK